MAEGPAGRVLQQQPEAFTQWPQENNCTKTTKFLRERRLVESVSSLSLVGDAEEAQQHLWGCRASRIIGHNMFHLGVPKKSVLCIISPRWVCQLDLMGCSYFRSLANRLLLM